MTNSKATGSIPVSPAFLYLVDILHGARTRFIGEDGLAEALGQPRPESYMKRCEDLFYREFGPQAIALGLTLNQETYQALMRLAVPKEVNRTLYADLEATYVFNPGFDGGVGAIRPIAADHDAKTAVALRRWSDTLPGDLKTAIFESADYYGHPDGALHETEVRQLHQRVVSTMQAFDGDAGLCQLQARQLAILLGALVKASAD